MKKRLARLAEALKVDALYFTHLTNIRYLTGFTGSAAFVLAGPDFRLFFSDSRYAIQMKRQVHKDFGTHVVKGYAETLTETLKRLKAKRVAFEAQHLTVAALETLKKRHPGITWIPMMTDAVAEWRMIKTPAELEIIRRATRIAAKSWKQATDGLARGEFRTEKQLAKRLEYLMGINGAEKPSFETIVASGPNSALPHHRSGPARLRNNQFLLTDYGVVHEGYCSDETITRFVGKPTAEHRKIHRIVKEAHDRAIDAVKPGKTTGDIDTVARDFIKDAGYGPAFGHSTGHGVGLDTHEAPSVAPKTTTVLKPGMIITVEPGIYIEGWGGVRIEDMILVTPKGGEVLTHIPKDFKTFALG